MHHGTYARGGGVAKFVVIPGRVEDANPESRDSPVRDCAPEVWSFGPSRNDGGRHRAPDTEPLAIPACPSIAGIIINRIPQSLGRAGPMWYLANAAFDRHT